jgi:glycosyltransferase involved in cell wall biosynthesis
MPRVSVVVPVHDTERYLQECLESVVSQSLKDIEIICVNDGSSDGSADILSEYASRDDRITVIDQTNQGPSGARNAGFSVACGEYILFVDSDDIIGSNAIADLYGRASEDRLDVLYFDATPFCEDADLESVHLRYKAYYTRADDYPGIMTGRRLLTGMTDNNDFLPSVCLQMIRRDYYSDVGLSFYEGVLHEDNLFSFLCALQASRVEYLPRPYYRRRIRKDSVMTSEKSMENFRGFFIGYLEMLRFVFQKDLDEQTSAAVAKLCAEMYRHALSVFYGLPKHDRDAVAQIDTRPEALLACALLASQERGTRETRGLNKALRTSESRLRALRGSRSYRVARYVRRVVRLGKRI